MADPFLGQISLFPYNFAPQRWAFCNGQILSIASNTALFSLLGTSYGGNGQTTFGLPDLRGRVPVSQGQLAGGSFYDLGEETGTETVTLNTTMMPLHNHAFNASTDKTTVAVSSNNTLGKAQKGSVQQGISKGLIYAPNTSPQTAMAPTSLNPYGGNQAHNNLQPYLTLNFCICLQGIFPSRN